MTARPALLLLVTALASPAGCTLEPLAVPGCRIGQCNDGNPCTTDRCDEQLGNCLFEPVAGGTDCSVDGDVCNGVERCDGLGRCMGGEPVNSDDGDPCTEDECDPLTGVVSHQPIMGCDVIEAGWTAVASEGAPSPRALHGAVWTGTEMIVWGGKVTGSVPAVNDGARYDPSTDAWTPMTDVGAPAPRHSRGAVWTGSEMIVWGGFGASDYVTDGARYDPSADTWTAISSVGAPQGRTFHTTLWTGDELVVWGGLQGTTVLADGARYDPSSDTWAPMTASGAPSARLVPAAAWTGTEVVLWGGGNTFDWLDDGAFYDPAQDAWTAATPMDQVPRFREQASAAWTGSHFLIWGGWDGGNYLKDGALLAPGATSWEPLSDVNAPNPRAQHLTLWTGDALFVWGGCAGQACNVIQGDGGIWRNTGADGTWSPVLEDDTLSGRRDPRGVYTGREVIVWGGRDDGGNLGDGARAVLAGFDR